MAKNKKSQIRKSEAELAVEGFVSARELMPGVLKKMEAEFSGLGVGLAPDLVPGGLLPGTLSVICSMPSIGKTAYLVNLALQLQSLGKNTAVFLPDLTSQEFLLRAMCARALVNLHALRAGRLPREKWAELMRAAETVSSPGLYFCRSSLMTDRDVARDMRALEKELGKTGRRLDVVIVDSLNYLKEDDFSITRLGTLREMAKAMKVAVIGSYGLRQDEKTENGCITLADIRHNGLDEQETDSVLLLHRAEYYHREDPTLKNKASLLQVYSSTRWVRNLELYFRHETQTFSRVAPNIAGPLPEQEEPG